MTITGIRIMQLAPHVYGAVATALAQVLEEETPNFGVTTLLRRAHFLGQACWESDYFARFTENLNYIHATAIAAAFPHLAGRAAVLVGKPQQLANAAYAGKNGNGDEASGDGWRYRGRGIFDLTGKTNYTLAGKALGLDLAGDPDLAATPDGAVKTALWFWEARHCNIPADLNDCQQVTRLINGPALEGLSNRIALTESAMRIFA